MARNDDSARALLPSIIIGVAIVLGAWAIKSSLDKSADNLDSIRLALADTKQALQQVAQARPAQGGAAARGGRPDPTRRYTVNTAGAPAKGPASAKVKIVEFSDSQ
jgi:hypothetical protein